ISSKSGACHESIASHALLLSISSAISVSIAILDCDFASMSRRALLLSIPAAFVSGRAALDHDPSWRERYMESQSHLPALADVSNCRPVVDETIDLRFVSVKWNRIPFVMKQF
ncbi:MAG: hypothetical protein ACOYOU_19370, partial [Kiritimatiellia bacterium]